MLPAAVLVLLAAVVSTYLFATVPLGEDIGARPSRVLDARGRVVGTLSPSVARQDVPLAALPDHVPDAVLAAEDRGFYEHGGLSLTGILRALVTNVRERAVAAGGSTITQQYLKNAALTSERTLLRKAKEAVLAVKMERRFTKDEILERYLNTIYWGRGAYGVEAAARTYFGTSATDLSLNQAATLAGIIQAPEALDPRDAPERADRRRRHVLDGMRTEGWIGERTHQRTLAAGLPPVRRDRGVAPGANAYYLDAVTRELSAVLEAESIHAGLDIHTALDVRLQRLAQRAVRQRTRGRDHTGALVALDPATGGVRALVGGPNHTSQPFNFAVRGGNQVGSAFKAFTLAAFVTAGNHPASRYPAPARLHVSEAEAGASGCVQTGEYAPRNHSGRSLGPTTVRDATIASVNTVYVQIELEVGCFRVADTAEALGIPEQQDGSPVLTNHTSLTLGVADLTPMEMASAYGTLAAEGVRAPPHLVTRVEGPDGDVLHETEATPEGVFDSNDARIVTDVLRDVVTSGTGRAARLDRPVAGKTGTTDENRDAWFVGYIPQLVAAVWMGTADDSVPRQPLTGGGVPAETWAAFMEPAVAPMDVVGFGEPDLSGKTVIGRRPEPEPTTTAEPSRTPRRPAPPPIRTPEPEPTVEPTMPDPSPTVTTEPTPTPTPTPEPTATATPHDGGGAGAQQQAGGD